MKRQIEVAIGEAMEIIVILVMCLVTFGVVVLGGVLLFSVALACLVDWLVNSGSN